MCHRTKHRIRPLAFVILAILGLAGAGHAVVQNASGTLPAGVTVWATGDNYHVDGALTVPVGATLVIQPGVTVSFDANVGIDVSGILLTHHTNSTTAVTAGSASNPVIFEEGITGWKGITVKSGGNATLYYTMIAGVDTPGVALRTAGTTTKLYNCTFTDVDTAVLSAGSITTVDRCIIWGTYGPAIVKKGTAGRVTMTNTDYQGGVVNVTAGATNFVADPNFVDPAGDFNLQWPSVAIQKQNVANGIGAYWYDKGMNRPPVWTAMPDTAVKEGATLTLTVEATDPNDNPDLVYDEVSLPSGATFNADTRVLTYTPGVAAQTGLGAKTNIIIKVTDTSVPFVVNDTIGVYIINANRSITLTPPATAATDEFKEITLKFPAKDLDGDALEFSLREMPGSLPLAHSTIAWNATKDSAIVVWKPDSTFVKNAATKTFTLQVVASDSSFNKANFTRVGEKEKTNWFTVVKDITVTVTNKNVGPNWVAVLPDTNVFENATVRLVMNAANKDLDPLTYGIVTPLEGLSVKGDTLVYSPPPSVATNLVPNVIQTIVVNVTDNLVTITDTLKITVKNVNSAPVWGPAELIFPAARLDQVAVGELLAFKLNATDSDGDVMTFWQPATLPAGATYDSVGLVFEWTPTEAQAGLTKIIFKVSDGKETVSLTMNIIVTNIGLAAFDVPNDQGGKVVLTWNAYRGDTLVDEYTIWRALPDGALSKAARVTKVGTMNYAWEPVGHMNDVRRLPRYSYTAETLCDAVPDMPDATHIYMVSAVDGSDYYDSNIATVASEDNLAPAAPANPAAKVVADQVVLNWNANREADLANYAIYRGETPGFELIEAYATVSDTFFVDANIPPTSVAGKMLYYVVKAVDIHQNMSEGPELAVESPVGMITPAVYALGQNVPNPFNPSTTVRFSTTQAGHVSLVVYNVNGQEVRTLVNQTMPAGIHDITWNATDSDGRRVSSGVYLYRITSDEGTITRRMVLTR